MERQDIPLLPLNEFHDLYSSIDDTLLRGHQDLSFRAGLGVSKLTTFLFNPTTIGFNKQNEKDAMIEIATLTEQEKSDFNSGSKLLAIMNKYTIKSDMVQRLMHGVALTATLTKAYDAMLDIRSKDIEAESDPARKDKERDKEIEALAQFAASIDYGMTYGKLSRGESTQKLYEELSEKVHSNPRFKEGGMYHEAFKKHYETHKEKSIQERRATPEYQKYLEDCQKIKDATEALKTLQANTVQLIKDNNLSDDASAILTHIAKQIPTCGSAAALKQWANDYRLVVDDLHRQGIIKDASTCKKLIENMNHFEDKFEKVQGTGIYQKQAILVLSGMLRVTAYAFSQIGTVIPIIEVANPALAGLAETAKTPVKTSVMAVDKGVSYLKERVVASLGLQENSEDYFEKLFEPISWAEYTVSKQDVATKAIESGIDTAKETIASGIKTVKELPETVKKTVQDKVDEWFHGKKKEPGKEMSLDDYWQLATTVLKAAGYTTMSVGIVAGAATPAAPVVAAALLLAASLYGAGKHAKDFNQSLQEVLKDRDYYLKECETHDKLLYGYARSVAEHEKTPRFVEIMNHAQKKQFEDEYHARDNPLPTFIEATRMTESPDVRKKREVDKSSVEDMTLAISKRLGITPVNHEDEIEMQDMRMPTAKQKNKRSDVIDNPRQDSSPKKSGYGK